jgi:hypothetical protein
MIKIDVKNQTPQTFGDEGSTLQSKQGSFIMFFTCSVTPVLRPCISGKSS